MRTFNETKWYILSLDGSKWNRLQDINSININKFHSINLWNDNFSYYGIGIYPIQNKRL